MLLQVIIPMNRELKLRKHIASAFCAVVADFNKKIVDIFKITFAVIQTDI